METNANLSNSIKSKEWVECESKKNPGKKYLFNKKTGQSKWLTTKNEKEPPIQVNKALKAPANERLKRLQQKLRSDEKTKKDIYKTTKTSHTKSHEIETKEKKKPNDPPLSPTKNTAIPTAIESLDRDKPKEISDPVLSTTTKKTAPTGGRAYVPEASSRTFTGRSAKNLQHNYRNATSQSGCNLDVATTTTTTTKKTALTPQERLKQKQQISKPESDVRKSPKNTKLRDIKAQKRILETRKQTNDEAKQKNLNKDSIIISKRFKIPRLTEKAISNNEILITPATTTITTQNNKAPKNTLIAKESLQSFKRVTDTEQKQLISHNSLPAGKSTKIEETAKNPMSSKEETISNLQPTFHHDISLGTEPVPETPELKFLKNMPNYNSTPISHLKRRANQRLECLREKLKKEKKSVEKAYLSDRNSNIFTNSSSLDYEEMDWEPSVENTTVSGFGFPAAHSEIMPEPTDMEVDDNLMLYAADKTLDTSINTKWRQTHLYIVVDTNIFINQLSFIECLKNEKPSDAAGVILYLPYSVLQELDKLKLRENIKYQVQRAIRYLNKMFETKDEHVQAQSALENRRHLIDIETADDNILNCCLQLLEHIPKVVLFSDDINLRNKAMCNNISIFKKSDYFQVPQKS